MKRTILLPIFAAAVLQISAQTWDKSHLDRVKENIGSPFYTEYLSLLIKEADALLGGGKRRPTRLSQSGTLFLTRLHKIRRSPLRQPRRHIQSGDQQP